VEGRSQGPARRPQPGAQRRDRARTGARSAEPLTPDRNEHASWLGVGWLFTPPPATRRAPPEGLPEAVLFLTCPAGAARNPLGDYSKCALDVVFGVCFASFPCRKRGIAHVVFTTCRRTTSEGSVVSTPATWTRVSGYGAKRPCRPHQVIVDCDRRGLPGRYLQAPPALCRRLLCQWPLT
jgi:hypothetical protein